MTVKTGVSLSALNAAKASETPFEFERLDENGNPSGIFLSVLGAHSATVKAGRNRLIDEQARRDTARAAAARPGKPADPTPFEETAAFAPSLAAVMLAGWRSPGDTDGLTAEQKKRFVGIEEPFSPENAVLLCDGDPESVSQIIEKSNKLGNFTKRSPQS